MTGGELLEKGKGIAAAARPWAPYVLAVVLALLLARGCNRAKEAEARAAAAEERARLGAAGQIVAQPVKDLGPRVAALEAENAELARALEEARRVAPGAKPVGVVTARTASVVVPPVPRPPDPPAPAGAPPPTCVLAAGDALRLDVDEVLLETRAGNRLLVGTAAAWRTSPGEPSLLLRTPFSAPVTVVDEKAAPASAAGSRWGAGPWAGISERGALYGAQAASPALRVPLLDWRLEANALGAAGPGGWLLGGGFLVRP